MSTLLSGPAHAREAAGRAGDLDTIDSTGTSSTFEGVPAAAVAAPADRPSSTKPVRSGCPRCGSQEPWGAASWCPECGFYPAFDKLEPGAEPQPGTEAEAQPRSALQEIPSWVWLLAGGCLVIFIATVAAKLLIPARSPYLVLCTLLQTVVGGTVALVAHIAAYMTAIQKSDKHSPLDLIMNPVEIWRPTIARLPQTRRRVCLVAWGTTALLCASAILGGYDVNALFEEDWVDPRPQKNLLHEIVKEARREREAEHGSLEDAMNAFVGDAQPPVMEVELIDTDCLIIGYVKPLKGKQGFASILLGSVPPGGKLSFVGTLRTDELPMDVRELLAARMPTLVRAKPFVEAAGYDAVWLRPVLMCRISHESWTEGNFLKGAVFTKMLPDVKVDGR